MQYYDFCSYKTTDGGVSRVFQWNETAVRTNGSTSCIIVHLERCEQDCTSGDTWTVAHFLHSTVD